jgi:YYY domain-containing protein
VLDAVRVLLLVEALGLAAAPLAGLLLARLPGRGLGFAKPLGLLLATWLVWMAGSLGLVAYGTAAGVGACLVVAVAGAAVWWRGGRPIPTGEGRSLFAWSEAIFAVAFAAMTLLVSFAPDIWGTEKPMDMAIVNAANQSTSFPPHDPWMAGEDVNYYYLGHVMAALVIRLTGVEPTVGYNLALALTFALTVTAVFTLAASLWAAARRPLALRHSPVAVGLTAVLLCVVLGNLAGAEKLIGDGKPLVEYDWFAASRVIPDTINEFPWFSFLLGDLHAHVVALPFTLLALGFVVQVALAGPRWIELGGAALATGALYAINAWSYPVVAGLMVLALAAGARRAARTIAWGAAFLALSLLVVLPFHLDYDPAARGIDLVRDHRPFTRFVRDQALLYGLFAWILAAGYLARLRTTRHPARNAAWLGVAAIVLGSLLAEHDLAGLAAVAVALAVAIDAMTSSRLSPPERTLWLLVAGGLTCVLVPEIVYVRDEFDGGPLARMNTVFKLGYQAWVLLAIAAACALPWHRRWLPGRWRTALAAGAAPLLVLAALYPIAGTYARTGGFGDSPHLDGIRWLPAGDVRAIEWLRERAPGDAVVLEAVGDDYSPAGHARISTFTGLSTVMGWTGHELQWQHDPGTRREEVRRAYAATDPAEAEPLLRRYGVRYVTVGPIERSEYGTAGIAKWDRLGRRVLDVQGTAVWEVEP